MLIAPNISLIKSSGSNIYFIKSDKNFLIDSGSSKDVSYLLDTLNQDFNSEIKFSDLDFVVNTHCHFDHIAGDDFLKTKGIDLYTHRISAEYIEESDSKFTLQKFFGGKLESCEVDRKLEDYEKIEGTGFKVLWTSGHSKGSICLYNENRRILISGDTLFSKGKFGRTDLPGGDKLELKKSIKKLNELDVKFLLPGHGQPVIENAQQSIKKSFSRVKKEL